MKALLREEEEKTQVSANKDTNIGSSSHDPQQGSYNYYIIAIYIFGIKLQWPCKNKGNC